MSQLSFSDEVKISRWDGEELMLLKFKSGDEYIEVVIPEFVARKMAKQMEWLLDDSNENE